MFARALERRLIAGRCGGPGRRRPAWRCLPRVIGPIVTALALAACASGGQATGSVRARTVLDRAATAAVAVIQPAFGPGRFWYVRSVQRTDAPGVPRFRLTVETWSGFDGTTRIRSASQAANVSGQDSVTIGDPDYGAGAGIGLGAALFTSSQLLSLPTRSRQLRATLNAAEAALSRQETALKIQLRHTPGSGTSQMVLHSDLTASQQHTMELLETATSLLAGPVGPDVRGALYRLIATLPGLRYDGRVRDPIGRLGTAVSIGGGRARMTITFDPATGALLSESADGVLTQTILAEGVTPSFERVPSGLTATAANAPAILLARVSPHVGAASTVFHVVQSTRKTPMQDTLQGPTATNCKAELFPGPSPKLSGGARADVSGGGLRRPGYRYSFGPASIGRAAWCRGRYQLEVTGLNGREATAYFYVN